jgi:hypothetical protein
VNQRSYVGIIINPTDENRHKKKLLLVDVLF